MSNVMFYKANGIKWGIDSVLRCHNGTYAL